MSSTGNGKSDPLLYFIFLRIVEFFFTFFEQIRPNPVFDVMLQTHSSPRREAASPPPVRCTTAKKANTDRALQLHCGSRSYISNLAV
jgi:hypothetical protein